MRLQHLNLHNYRGFRDLDLELPAGLVVLHGNNAAGKSNLLEALYMLALTRPYRADNEREVLHFHAQSEDAYTRVAGSTIGRDGASTRVRIDLLWHPRGDSNVGASVLHKRIRVNGIPRLASEAIGIVSAVLFSVEDIELVVGPPALRRHFMNVALSQIDRGYLRVLQRYQKVLTQRNHLLRLIREGKSLPDELLFWDEELSWHGGDITCRRQLMVKQLADQAADFYTSVAEGVETLEVKYEPSVMAEASVKALAQKMRERMEATRGREIGAGQSLVGPHRDDVKLLIETREAGRYGSRGQARSVALALRMAEARLLAQERGDNPILLLDDLLSELDGPRRRQVLNVAAGVDQAILSVVDLKRYSEPRLWAAPRFLVASGTVTRQDESGDDAEPPQT